MNDNFLNMPCYSILQFFIIVLKFLRSPCSSTWSNGGSVSSNTNLVTHTPRHTADMVYITEDKGVCV